MTVTFLVTVAGVPAESVIVKVTKVTIVSALMELIFAPTVKVLPVTGTGLVITALLSVVTVNGAVPPVIVNVAVVVPALQAAVFSQIVADDGATIIAPAAVVIVNVAGAVSPLVSWIVYVTF
jgi:hypothetical protein